MLTLQQIIDRYNETRSIRGAYEQQMSEWEDMYMLEYWTDDDRREAQAEGRLLATVEEPRNAVQLAMRLIGSVASIRVPIGALRPGAYESSKRREEFLRILLRSQSNAQRYDPIASIKWNMLVRGAAALKVGWMRDVYPKKLRNVYPAIRYQSLDPLNVGVQYGELYPSWAYHHFRRTVREVKQRWPEASLKQYQDRDDITVVDFWWPDPDKGDVWNAVAANDSEFLKKPYKTKYLKLPIVERFNDPAPASRESKTFSSLLESLRPGWGQRNMLRSMHLSAVSRFFWKSRWYVNQYGEPMEDPDETPGAWNKLPPGSQFIAPPGDQPDTNLLTSLEQKFDMEAGMGSFPPVLYGDPGPMASAYGIPMLANAARGRVQGTVDQLQALLAEANQIALCLVQELGGKGVSASAYIEGYEGMKTAFLTPDDVGGEYLNEVALGLNVPGNDMQMAMLALQWATAGGLSWRTARRDFLPNPVPADEEERILYEKMISDPDLFKGVARQAAAFYGLMLPEGEPDMQAPPAPQQQQAPVGSLPGLMQQQMPPQMNPGQLPPEMQGGITPELAGMGPNVPPNEWDLMQGGMPTPGGY